MDTLRCECVYVRIYALINIPYHNNNVHVCVAARQLWHVLPPFGGLPHQRPSSAVSVPTLGYLRWYERGGRSPRCCIR